MTRYLRTLPLFVGMLAVACAPALERPTAVTPAAIAYEHLDSAALHDHVHFLASDEMRGRDTPSPELERAAEYIADHFARSGVEPGATDGSFIERWTYRVTEMRPEQIRASASVEGEPMVWQYGSDFFAIPAHRTSAGGEILYAGTVQEVASSLPAEAEGRIVLAYLPGAPGAELMQAARQLERSGAAGFAFILNPMFQEPIIGQIAQGVEGGGAGVIEVPSIGLSFTAGSALLAAAGMDIDAVQADPGRDAIGVQVLPRVRVEIEIPARMETHEPPNVVGVVRGSDPELRDSYLVLTAHFDHVGVGAPDESGDTIYSGADDNASGTAMLMQLAAAFADLPEPPARSLVFLAVSGEEKGLLGSLAWVENPTVPLESVVGNINMDMVGRNHPDSVVVIGKPYTTMGAVAEQVAAEHPELRMILADDPDPSEMVFFRSDQFAFAREGIPAIFFTTWLHDDYHRPSDTPDKIRAEKMERLGRLVFHLTHRLADDPNPPEWTAEGEAILEQIR